MSNCFLVQSMCQTYSITNVKKVLQLRFHRGTRPKNHIGYGKASTITSAMIKPRNRTDSYTYILYHVSMYVDNKFQIAITIPHTYTCITNVNDISFLECLQKHSHEVKKEFSTISQNTSIQQNTYHDDLHPLLEIELFRSRDNDTNSP